MEKMLQDQVALENIITASPGLNKRSCCYGIGVLGQRLQDDKVLVTFPSSLHNITHLLPM